MSRRSCLGEGKPRERGDAVIALLPRHRDMRKPSARSSSSGNLPSTHLISCRHSTSGCSARTKRLTRSSRSLTELMFQVARRKRMGTKDRCGSREKQARGRRPPHMLDAKTGGQIKKKPQRRGDSGLLRVPIGGNQWWGGKPITEPAYHLSQAMRCLFATSVNINAGPQLRPAGLTVRTSRHKRKAPNRCAWLGARSALFRAVPGGKPARANHIFG